MKFLKSEKFFRYFLEARCQKSNVRLGIFKTVSVVERKNKCQGKVNSFSGHGFPSGLRGFGNDPSFVF